MRRTRTPLVVALSLIVCLSAVSCRGLLKLDDPVSVNDASVPTGVVDGAADAEEVGARVEAGDGTAGCTTNAACSAANYDQPYRCNHATGQCVSLKTPRCPFVIASGTPKASYDDENAIFVGGILDIQDSEIDPSEPVTASTASVILAFQELQANSGIPANTPSGLRRPVVAVLWQRATAFQAEATLLTDVEHHLVAEVGANAVIAFLDDAPLEAFHHDYPGTFIFNPGYSDLTLDLSSEQAKGLIWSAIGDETDVAPTYGPLVTQLETIIESASPGLRAITVANIASNSPVDMVISPIIKGAITFNGKSPDANGASYLAPPFYSGVANSDLAGICSSILAQKSNIIIVNGGAEWFNTIIPNIEQNWDASVPRPYYILPNRLAPANDSTNALSAFLARRADGATLSRRIVGIAIESPPDGGAALTAYANRVAFSFQKLSGYGGAFNNFYDTAYATIFAAYASPASANDPLGSDFAAGMLNIVNGTTPLLIGPEAIPQSFDTLYHQTRTGDAGSGSVKFVGTMGPWDSNTTTFARTARGSVYCMRAIGANKYQYAPDVYRYSDATRQLVNPVLDACHAGYPF